MGPAGVHRSKTVVSRKSSVISIGPAVRVSELQGPGFFQVERLRIDQVVIQAQSTAVRARFCVDAHIGEAEPLNGTAVDQMLLHNLRGIFGLYMAVPHGLGIYDDGWPVLALVKAA